jgi:hypothetical protein
MGKLRYQNSNSDVKSDIGLPTNRGLLYELLIMYMVIRMRFWQSRNHSV